MPLSVPKRSTWMHDGKQKEIVTPEEPPETNAEWTERHREAVANAKARWPVDSQ